MANTSVNRRIGSRSSVRFPVTVQLALEKKHLFRRAKVVDGVITNLSVSGARLECSAVSWLSVRSHTLIGHANGTALAEVRSVESTTSGNAQYGLMFIEMSDVFAAALHEQLSTGRDDELDWRWDRAR